MSGDPRSTKPNELRVVFASLRLCVKIHAPNSYTQPYMPATQYARHPATGDYLHAANYQISET